MPNMEKLVTTFTLRKTGQTMSAVLETVEQEENIDIFINKKGKVLNEIPNDKGHNRVFIIKTDEKEFDSENVYSAGITKDEYNKTEKFISKNLPEAFTPNCIAYQNSIEIEYRESTREAMLEVAKNDKGYEPSNLYEYGASISNEGIVGEVQRGPKHIPGETQKKYAEVEITTDSNTKSIMHTHQSYEKKEGEPKAGEFKPSYTVITKNMAQAPSDRDIENCSYEVNYVFAMRTKKIYMYNNKGVLAILDQKNFVKFKK